MLDIAETETDRRPAILICAYDPADGTWGLIETLSNETWSPPGTRSITIHGGDPDGLAAGLSERLGRNSCTALLLVGRTQSNTQFRVQMRAENRRPRGAERIFSTGPSVARSTAPVAEIVRALQDEGLTVSATSQAEEDAGDYLLYRILTALPDGADVPSIGLLRAAEGLEPDTVRRGVKAAAIAMAQRLSPLPRTVSS